jgi:hypothetical protein
VVDARQPEAQVAQHIQGVVLERLTLWYGHRL